MVADKIVPQAIEKKPLCTILEIVFCEVWLYMCQCMVVDSCTTRNTLSTHPQVPNFVLFLVKPASSIDHPGLNPTFCPFSFSACKGHLLSKMQLGIISLPKRSSPFGWIKCVRLSALNTCFRRRRVSVVSVFFFHIDAHIHRSNRCM